MSQEIRARWESQRAGFAALRELPLAKADQEAGELIQMHDDIGVLLSENEALRRQYRADGLEKAALAAQAQRDAEAVEVSRKNAREGWAAAHAAVDRAIAAEQEIARLRERIESGKQAVELRERALAAAEQRVRELQTENERLTARIAEVEGAMFGAGVLQAARAVPDVVNALWELHASGDLLAQELQEDEPGLVGIIKRFNLALDAAEIALRAQPAPAQGDPQPHVRCAEAHADRAALLAQAQRDAEALARLTAALAAAEAARDLYVTKITELSGRLEKIAAWWGMVKADQVYMERGGSLAVAHIDEALRGVSDASHYERLLADSTTRCAAAEQQTAHLQAVDKMLRDQLAAAEQEIARLKAGR